MTTTQEKCGTIFESGSEVIFHGYYKPQRISDWKFLEEKGNWLKPFNCELTFKVENDKIISSFQNEAYPASVCELSTDIWVYQDNDTKRFELYMMFGNITMYHTYYVNTYLYLGVRFHSRLDF